MSDFRKMLERINGGPLPEPSTGFTGGPFAPFASPMPEPKKTDPNKLEALQMMGRCANGAERDSGRLWHAVQGQSWKALCGAAPGRNSAGWSSRIGESVTCPRCARRIAGQARQTARVPA